MPAPINLWGILLAGAVVAALGFVALVGIVVLLLWPAESAPPEPLPPDAPAVLAKADLSKRPSDKGPDASIGPAPKPGPADTAKDDGTAVNPKETEPTDKSDPPPLKGSPSSKDPSDVNPTKPKEPSERKDTSPAKEMSNPAIAKSKLPAKLPPLKFGAPRTISSSSVRALAFVGEGRQLLCRADDNVHLWDLEADKDAFVIKGTKSAGSISVDKAGKRAVVVATTATSVGLVDLGNGKLVGALPLAQGSKVMDVAISLDGKQVVVAGTGGPVAPKGQNYWVSLWDFEKRVELYNFGRIGPLFNGLAACEGDRVVGVFGRFIRVFDLKTRGASEQLPIDVIARGTCAVSSDGRLVAFGCKVGPKANDDRWQILDLTARMEIAFSPRLSALPSALAFSADGKYVALALESDPFVRLHDARDLTELGKIAGPAGAQKILALAFSPDGKYLAAGGWGQGGASLARCCVWPIVDAGRPSGPSDR
jgi:hypothetical protein